MVNYIMKQSQVVKVINVIIIIIVIFIVIVDLKVMDNSRDKASVLLAFTLVKRKLMLEDLLF